MLAPLLLGSLALHPAACVQRSSLRSAPAPAAARLYGLPPPLLQPATRVRRRVPSAPSMVSAEFAAPLIDLGVRVDTFLPQFAWLLIVALPQSKITERIMGPIGPILALSLIHLGIVGLAATSPGGTEPILIFADVFDPAQSQLDGMVRLFQVLGSASSMRPYEYQGDRLNPTPTPTPNPNQVRDFVAEEWPHVLIWDLFVGRAIWLDALERGTPFAWSSLLLTNGIGPPGL